MPSARLLIVLGLLGTLPLAACRNETPEAQQRASEARESWREAGQQTESAARATGEALRDTAQSAAASTREALGEAEQRLDRRDRVDETPPPAQPPREDVPPPEPARR
ncbi:hypothetical protein [Coralloluteibacterium thermophilus]|uniref:Lipoprotein n=1 Tax=Coralloluteibacterium thermophilum TaxID=2707049 RepID=A0ABV9NNA6_9GAMM